MSWGFHDWLLLKAVITVMVQKCKKKNISTTFFFKEYIVMIPQCQCMSQRSTSSAAELQYILVNSGTEILNNLNSMKNMLKDCLSPNFVPMKCKELLAENVERVVHLIKL